MINFADSTHSEFWLFTPEQLLHRGELKKSHTLSKIE